ncbi:MAG: hypothetical protein R2856_09175 [Caldilineaceae bacterium]
MSFQDTLPSVLNLVPDSLSATVGEVLFEPVQKMLTWSGVLVQNVGAIFNSTENYMWGDSDAKGDVRDVLFTWDEVADTGRFVINGDDRVECDQAIGFDFPFYGETHTELCISTNGYMTLGENAIYSIYPYCPFPNSYPVGIIAGHAQDLVVVDGIYAETLGQAPNRRLIVQWKDARRYGYDYEPTVDFQIVLFETGDIEVRVQRTPAVRSSDVIVGVQAPSGALGTTYAGGSPPQHDLLAVKFLAPGRSSGGPSAQVAYAVSLAPGVDANTTLTNTALLQTPSGPLESSVSVLANPLSFDGSSAQAALDEVPVGQPLNYEFVVRNTGLVTATNAQLRNALPSELAYVPDTLTCSMETCSATANRITWQGAVGPGQAVTVTYSATVDIRVPDLTVVENTAQIDDGYGVTTEISATVHARQADLAGSFVEVDPPIVRPGDTVTYTIYLRNSGGEDVVVDAYHALPPGMSYIAGSLWCGAGVCDMQDDTIHWQGLLNRRVLMPVRIRAQIAADVAPGSRVVGSLELQRADRTEPYTMSTQFWLEQLFYLGGILEVDWRLYLPITKQQQYLEVVPVPLPTPTPLPFATPLPSVLPTPTPHRR